LAYSQQSGRPVELRATIFASLATDTNEQPGPQTRTADLPVLGANGAKGVQEVPMAVARNTILDWIRNGVPVKQFFVPFKGKYGNEAFNHSFPPNKHFPNNRKFKL